MNDGLNRIFIWVVLGSKRILATLMIFILAACSTPVLAVGAEPDDAKTSPRTAGDPAERTIPQFFSDHCFRCHGKDKQKGKFRLDTASIDPAKTEFGLPWSQAIERINAGEMPPKGEPQPTAAERLAAAEWINEGLRAWESAKFATSERMSFKKLTRGEYVNTLRDLIGVTYHPTDPGGLPEDPNWRGFERIGSVLSLSTSHIERYVSAAENALKEAMPLTEAPPPWKVRWNALAVKFGDPRVDLPRGAISEKHRLVIGPASNWQTRPGGLIGIQLPRSGEYRIRIGCSGLRPEGGSLPHLQFYDATIDRVLFEQDVDAAEDKPIVVETKVRLTAGGHDLVLRNQLPGPSTYDPFARASNVDEFTTLRKGRAPYLQKFTDDDYKPMFPLLFLDFVELSTADDEWPPAFQKRVLTPGAKDQEHAKTILQAFAERAFRRPLKPGEIDRFVTIAKDSQSSGATFEEGIRDAILAVLCAHDFLFLVEGSPEVARMQLNDWELASRLSYFLWSTMPDDSLLAQARSGRLHDARVLETEFKRMLADPRSERFAYEFAREWLQLKDVGKFPPDKKLYPDYDEQLQASMIAEPQAFFLRVLTENRSIRDFLTSDWTMANGRLSEHYGIAGVVDHELKPVSLKPEHHRGGLLTQAAILSLTSDGSRHRPVHRGKWILESIFGTSPPPPPPNVGTIPTPAEGQPKTTIRAKLEAHRSNANCAACHAKIDPLGLAFDNYDAIGRWRDVETSKVGVGDSPPVNASGVLADGRSFAGPEEFKQLLASDLDRFAVAFTEKLATYALRRGISTTERQAIEKIAAQAKSDGYRLQSLISSLVLSELFQGR